MRRKVIITAVALLVLASCRLPSNIQPPPAETPAPMDGGEIQPPAAASNALLALAAELNIPVNLITIRQIEQVEWQDTCLGAPTGGEVCAQQIVPGFRVTLAVEQSTYTYHTDFSGENIRRVEQVSQPGPAASQAVQLLAGLLGFDPASIRVLSENETLYEDTCLEINIAELPCGQFSTRGLSIRLLAEGIIYEFRTPVDNIELALADIDGFSTVIPVLNWSRRGGREEYCDGLKVYLNGSVIQYNCRDYAGQNPGIKRLSPEDLRQLLHWYLQYNPFEYNLAGLGGSVVQLYFVGRGQENPDFVQQQEIDAYCSRLLEPVLTGTLPPNELTPAP